MITRYKISVKTFLGIKKGEEKDGSSSVNYSQTPVYMRH
jgi:hypothetical protein